MQVGEAEILGHIRDRIARYKQPVRVVVWDALPKSGYGKVPKTLVKARLAEDGVAF
jgi:acyl-CoA synthetase (AMP-forming)/AMP-acid ligase II